MTNTYGRRAVVTGAAGFIGSHLSERLVADGWRVTGIDCFTDFYARQDKLENLANLENEPAFDLVERNLAGDGWQSALTDASAVFHLAAQAGVRDSFGDTFVDYASNNLVATQRVFEAADLAGTGRVVWASSSSVYGDAEAHPCREVSTPTMPRSPYGVTKRACEDLARVYRNRGLAITGLRYFTVYGPRQRPDMAMRRICEALASGNTSQLFGDGSQSRDFTYVADAVDATVRCADAPATALIYNIGGGEEASMAHVIATLESLAHARLLVDRRPPQRGDVRRTSADVALARRDPRPPPRPASPPPATAGCGAPALGRRRARPPRPRLVTDRLAQRGVGGPARLGALAGTASRGLRVTTRLAVVMSGFPRTSETFAIGELVALSRAGMLARLYATKAGDGAVPQPGVDELLPLLRMLPVGDAAEQAAALVTDLTGLGVDGVHGYFAHQPAEVAAHAASALGVGFS